MKSSRFKTQSVNSSEILRTKVCISIFSEIYENHTEIKGSMNVYLKVWC